MPAALEYIWVYLSAQPLLWLSATLAAYVLGDWLYRRSGERAAVNAVAIAIALLIGLLELAGTGYRQYLSGAQFVHFMLGPAVVALAVPLYRNCQAIRQSIVPIAAALAAGALTAIVSALAIAHALTGLTKALLVLPLMLLFRCLAPEPNLDLGTRANHISAVCGRAKSIHGNSYGLRNNGARRETACCSNGTKAWHGGPATHDGSGTANL